MARVSIVVRLVANCYTSFTFTLQCCCFVSVHILTDLYRRCRVVSHCAACELYPLYHLLLLLLFFYPGTQFPGSEKITLCNTKKVQKSSWNEPYSSSSTKQSCSKMALYQNGEYWNKKLISLSSPLLSLLSWSCADDDWRRYLGCEAWAACGTEQWLSAATGRARRCRSADYRQLY